MDLNAAATAIVDRLTAAGIRASVDARDLHPPCVQVRPPTMTFRFGKGDWDATWELWLIVPDAGQAQAFAELGTLIDQVQAALGHVGTTARPDTVALTDGATAPAYILTTTSRIHA